MSKKPIYAELQRRIAGLEAQQQQQQALNESKARLNGILANLQDAYLRADLNGYFTLLSPSAVQMFGYDSVEEMIGLSAETLYADKEARTLLLDAVRRSGRVNDWISQGKRKDGSTFWISMSVQFRRGSTGEIVGSEGVIRDITDRRQAEQELFDSSERLSALMNALPVAVSFSDDATCQRITGNPALLAQFEITPSDNISASAPDPAAAGRRVRFFHDGREIQDFELPLQRAVAENREISSIDLDVHLPSGRRWFASASGAPIHNQRGDVVGGVAVTMDVTARKQAEEDLRRSEERFRSVLEGSRDVIYRLNLQTGRYEYINPSAQAVVGFTPEELKTQDAQAALAMIHPDDRSAMQAEVARLEKIGETDVEYRQRTKSGDYRWLSNHMSLIRDGAGRPMYRDGSIRDITERKRAEDALRESEESKRIAEVLASSEREFRLLAEAMPQIVWVTRADGWNTYFNHQWIDYTGLTLEESYGHGWNIPFHPEDQQRAWNAWQNAVTNLASYALECRLRRADGVYRWWLIRGVPVLGEKGNILKWFGTCTDIEDLKRAEEALREANADLEQRAVQLRALAGELTLSEQRERSRLAEVLHDHLQQLLVAAKFRVTILGRGGDDVVKQACTEVEDLIDESIAASRSLTAELSPPILHEAGLNAGLQWLARQMADKHGLFVDLEMEEHEPLSEQLKILLFESVRELLFNVVKHARTGSANINLRHVHNHLQVTVSDQGAGFDPTTMSIAGEQGRGFGLFAIRERLGFMGGTLQIQSTPGQGSRFILAVPLAPTVKIEPQSQRIAVSPDVHFTPSSDPVPGWKIRVMLVDDHAVVRQGIANLLRNEHDIEVVGEAADGHDAVDQANRLQPDVILMDMSMPKLNGIEATRIIHNDWPDIRIIGLSMFEEADRAQAMRDVGAVDYMTKSGPAEELINAIRTSIRGLIKAPSAKTPS